MDLNPHHSDLKSLKKDIKTIIENYWDQLKKYNQNWEKEIDLRWRKSKEINDDRSSVVSDYEGKKFNEDFKKIQEKMISDVYETI